MERAHEHFGRLDNVGYRHFEMVEEISEPYARAQIETNPVRRSLGEASGSADPSGTARRHIVLVLSLKGSRRSRKSGVYHASTWALEGLSQALAQGVPKFGHTGNPPGAQGLSTDWGGPSAKHSQALEAYAEIQASTDAGRAWAGRPVTRSSRRRRSSSSARDPAAPACLLRSHAAIHGRSRLREPCSHLAGMAASR